MTGLVAVGTSEKSTGSTQPGLRLRLRLRPVDGPATGRPGTGRPGTPAAARPNPRPGRRQAPGVG